MPDITICGFCDEGLNLDEVDHSCYDQELFDLSLEIPVTPFHYSSATLAEAEQFLTDNPEFREFQNLTAHNAVGNFNTADELEFITPMNYCLSTGLPVEVLTFTDPSDREGEWEGIYLNRDNYQVVASLSGWRDVEPNRCTHAKSWWNYRDGGYYSDHHMPTTPAKAEPWTELSFYELKAESLDFNHANLIRFSFNELQGFATTQLIDFGITEAYQYRLFNIFQGRDTRLHIGQLTLSTSVDGRPQVTCSTNGCHYRHTPFVFAGDLDSRTDQEAFTHALIRHGNNHGPDFYTSRKDFAYIHATNCSTTHTPKQACNADNPRLPYSTLTLTEALDFLIKHRKFCRATNCRCTAYYHSLNHYSNNHKVAA